MRLTVEQLHITLDRQPILRDVGLEVPPGAVVGLVGPNGSGKSTLLRAVYRSLRPRTGVVRVGGDDVWTLSSRDAARRTAAVLQDGGSVSGLSVTEIVTLGRTPITASSAGTAPTTAGLWTTPSGNAARTSSPTATSPPCPAANANASSSPAPWPSIPTSWFSTNSPTTWTSGPASNSST